MAAVALIFFFVIRKDVKSKKDKTPEHLEAENALAEMVGDVVSFDLTFEVQQYVIWANEIYEAFKGYSWYGSNSYDIVSDIFDKFFEHWNHYDFLMIMAKFGYKDGVNLIGWLKYEDKTRYRPIIDALEESIKWKNEGNV